MNNNWQILAMWESLIQIQIKCGGSPDEVSAEKLSKMTALELMELLSPNDVRFCIKEKKPTPAEINTRKPRNKYSTSPRTCDLYSYTKKRKY